MNQNEIVELAMWTAHSISDAFKESGFNISAIDENFIAQFVHILVEDWQRGLAIDANHVFSRAANLDDFKNKKISQAALNVILIFAEKFPEFVKQSKLEDALNSNAVKV